jgi:hypothetical protein
MRLAAISLVSIGLAFACAATAQAQQVRGIVHDVDGRMPVSAADVRLLRADGGLVASTTTNDDGRFVLNVTRGGAMRLEVRHVAYADPDPIEVVVADGEAVDVEVRLSRSAVALDPIVVTGRSRDLRHERSYVAALTRRATLPRVGNRRVMLRNDPEMRNAMAVSDVFMWTPAPMACRIVFLDGQSMTPDTGAALLETSANNYAAVEFYRTWQEAPRDYRRLPLGGDFYMDCSIVALWTR